MLARKDEVWLQVAAVETRIAARLQIHFKGRN